jgi:hypothetical protein
MKRICVPLLAFLFLLTGPMAAKAGAQSPSSRPPAFVFLRVKAGDAINIEMTEDRLRRTLQMLGALRKEYPSANVTATVYVNGAVSDLLAQRNSTTGVRDLLLSSAREGLIEIGYDGADEPRSAEQPVLMDYRDVSNPIEDYLARVAVAERVLTDGRDPVTGKLLPDADGGLKRTQQVFGEVSSIWGTQVFAKDLGVGTMPDWGSDAEVVQQIRLMNTRATMAGVLDDVPHMDFFYDDWVGPFSKNLSASADSSPDLYWQENRLRISERSDKASEVVKASGGSAALKDYFGKLDRSKIRVVQIEVGDDRNYLLPAFRRPPVTYPTSVYAATHPAAPKLPKEAFNTEADIKAGFQKEQDALDWLMKNLVSENPDAKAVSNKDLLNMTSPCSGFRVSTSSLRRSIADLDKSWGDNPVPPKYVNVDGRFLSLAQTFQVLAEALVDRHRTGKLPESVEVLNVYGPIDMPKGTGAQNGEVSASAVALAAVYILPALYEDHWSPIPRNAVPGQVRIGDVTLNGAQYLHLMMKAFLVDDVDTKLAVTPAQMVWAPEAVAFKTRPTADMGAIWTIKPAPIETSKMTGTGQ